MKAEPSTSSPSRSIPRSITRHHSQLHRGRREPRRGRALESRRQRRERRVGARGLRASRRRHRVSSGADNTASFEALFAREENRGSLRPHRRPDARRHQDRRPVSHQTTDINFPGPARHAARSRSAHAERSPRSRRSCFVLAGSLPPGVDAAIYRHLVTTLRSPRQARRPRRQRRTAAPRARGAAAPHQAEHPRARRAARRVAERRDRGHRRRASTHRARHRAGRRFDGPGRRLFRHRGGSRHRAPAGRGGAQHRRRGRCDGRRHRLRAVTRAHARRDRATRHRVLRQSAHPQARPERRNLGRAGEHRNE